MSSGSDSDRPCCSSFGCPIGRDPDGSEIPIRDRSSKEQLREQGEVQRCCVITQNKASGKAGEGPDFFLASEIELGVAVEEKIGVVKSMACVWKMMTEPMRSL